MGGTLQKKWLVFFLVVSCAVVSINGQLAYQYYKKSCSTAESIITAAVQKAYNSDRSITAAMIRLLFHDCFVRGCDASVLLDGPNSEKVGPPNVNSLRGFEVIDEAKANIEAVCPGVVSCADVLAYAARDSIILAGGTIPFQYWLGGRKDGSVSIAFETLINLPPPFATLNQLLTLFAAKNLSQTEMITLSGAHTIGRANCGNVLNRLYNFQGTGKADPAINANYLVTLQTLCPPNSPGTFINMEQSTPAVLDRKYDTDVLGGKGLFQSDNALRTTNSSKLTLQALALSDVIFNNAFGLAMIKMSKMDVKLGSAGNIRIRCNTTDGAV